MIPLILRLKKQAHKEVAKAQDIIVETLYRTFDEAVIHGGTSIWRCYNGNRFSEDIDVYLNRDIKKIDRFFDNLKQRGFNIEKKKISQNSIYSTLKYNKTIVRFEALFKKIKGSLKEYETAEGNYITVYTLTPEELIKEKSETYLKRQKIRDLYDVFFLLRHVQDASQIKKVLTKLLNKFKKPIDEKDLRVIITEGLVPDVNQMLLYIKRKI